MDRELVSVNATEAPQRPLLHSTEAVASVSPATIARSSGNSDGPAAMLTRLLSGAEVDAEAMQWLARGFRTWLSNDGALTLPACLGLHARPFAVRVQVRDCWLREAERHLRLESPRDSRPWRRATRLHAVALQFLGSKWPSWKRLSEPPWKAGEVNVALYLAARAHSRFPETVKQYANIIFAGVETKTADDFTPPLPDSA